jgi:hypothetical protein
VVYQCVEVINVTMVLPLLNTTTAVLVSIPLVFDERSVVKEFCVELVADGANDVTAAGVLYALLLVVLEIAVATEEVVDGRSTEEAVAWEALDEAVDRLAEAVELEAAAQVAFRANCTPLLAQVDSNVATAAMGRSAMKCSRDGDLVILLCWSAQSQLVARQLSKLAW